MLRLATSKRTANKSRNEIDIVHIFSHRRESKPQRFLFFFRQEKERKTGKNFLIDPPELLTKFLSVYIESKIRRKFLCAQDTDDR